MQGVKKYYFEPIIVKNALELKLKANRVNIVLGNLVDGEFVAYKNNKYGSGMITPLVESSYIAAFNENTNMVEHGSKIEIIKLYTNPSR